jgi:hypothetical protein
MLGPTTTAANGNCVPRPPTAKSQADFDPKGVPIYTPPFDPSLAPPLDGEAVRIRPFALFYMGHLSFCRVEQIPWRTQLLNHGRYLAILLEPYGPPTHGITANWILYSPSRRSGWT